jgi:hypothetical protein
MAQVAVISPLSAERALKPNYDYSMDLAAMLGGSANPVPQSSILTSAYPFS